MSLDPPKKRVPTIVQDEDKTLNHRLLKAQACEDDPIEGFDLTGVTEIKVIFLNADNTTLVKLLTTSGVALVDAKAGKFQSFLTKAETILLALSPDGGLSDIEVRFTLAGKETIVLLPQSVKVAPRLFPVA